MCHPDTQVSGSIYPYKGAGTDIITAAWRDNNESSTIKAY